MVDVIINSNSPIKQLSQYKSLITERNPFLNCLKCLGNDHLPLADLLRQVFCLNQPCVVVSPIYWQATHNDVLIVAEGNSLSLDEAESQNIFNKMWGFFQKIDLSLYYADATTWLLALNSEQPLNSQPPHHMLNKSLMPFLKQLDDSLFWQKMLTEVQMYLASENINAVNGVWFYGQGLFRENNRKTVLTDYEDLFNNLPQQFKPLAGDSSIDKNTILLMNQSEKFDSSKIVAKHSVRWFWNDLAYYQPKKSWWTKCFGSTVIPV